MSSTTASALSAVDLWKRYRRGTWVLEGVTLSIGAGRVTALVGPNGAGKSTLIKTWMGFEAPSRGLALVYGIAPRVRSDGAPVVAYLPQRLALYRGLTVQDHISLAAWLRPRFDRSRAERWLRDASVPLYARASQLSGGQAGQVGLALAFGSRADILLLDEPVASLDPLARGEFLDALGAMVREDGPAVVLSSHVVSDIEQLCDWLVVLGRGHVVFDSSVADALAGHHVANAVDVADGDDVVASLPRSASVLIRTTVGAVATTRPATLQDVVIGYLVTARAAEAGDAGLAEA